MLNDNKSEKELNEIERTTSSNKKSTDPLEAIMTTQGDSEVKSYISSLILIKTKECTANPCRLFSSLWRFGTPMQKLLSALQKRSV